MFIGLQSALGVLSSSLVMTVSCFLLTETTQTQWPLLLGSRRSDDITLPKKQLQLSKECRVGLSMPASRGAKDTTMREGGQRLVKLSCDSLATCAGDTSCEIHAPCGRVLGEGGTWGGPHSTHNVTPSRLNESTMNIDILR